MDKCPMCGYADKVESKPLSPIASHYVNKDTKKEVVMHRVDEQFTTEVGEGKDKVVNTWIRKDKYVQADPTPTKK